MLDQVIFVMRKEAVKISNIVLMGIGEPLDNFDNVIRFLKLVTNPLGMNIGARHITISTCGILENIDKLADYGIQLTLAISLHAPDDMTRKHLMPIAHNNTVEELFAAGNRYFKKTGRRVTYEYSLINEINDKPEQAKMLSQWLLKTGSHLNIVPLNNIHGYEFMPSTKMRTKLFFKQLEQNGVNYTIRRSLGGDIDAACGLLRQRTNQLIGDN
jgi:23S rRNA (adenine2503-C2)-methyltransferase